MDLKSLITEFQKSRDADRSKGNNLESVYTTWAAQQIIKSSTEKAAHAHPISTEIASIRKNIKEGLESVVSLKSHGSTATDIDSRVLALESENKSMKSEICELKDLVQKLQLCVNKLSSTPAGTDTKAKDTQATQQKEHELKEAPKPQQADDEIDLFGSDEEEDEETAKIKAQRLKAYEEKKSKKPGPIAKSSIILDIKPWDDETDMGVMEKNVRSIQMDGLLWGASKLVPVGYGIKKLQIMCVVEDDKVSVEELQEKIEAYEDYVQSVDVAAFNKV